MWSKQRAYIIPHTSAIRTESQGSPEPKGAMLPNAHLAEKEALALKHRYTPSNQSLRQGQAIDSKHEDWAQWCHAIGLRGFGQNRDV